MKTSLKLRAALGVVAILATLLASPEAPARPPRAREARAVVQSIDRSNRTLTLKFPQGRGPDQVIWTKQTKFIHNAEFAPASELKESATAVVYYRSPFFGRAFATKVVWTNNQPSK